MVIKFNNTTKNYRQFAPHYVRPFLCNGREYVNIYHYLQTIRYKNEEEGGVNISEKIYGIADSVEISKYIYSLPENKRQKWKEHHYEMLLNVLRIKLYNDEEFRELLKSTDTYILEYVSLMDAELGTGVKNKGLNILGKALMEVRDEQLQN